MERRRTAERGGRVKRGREGGRASASVAPILSDFLPRIIAACFVLDRRMPSHTWSSLLRHNGMSAKIWSNSRGVLILPSVKSWTLTGQRMVNLLREIEVALSHLTLVGSALTYRAWRPLRTTLPASQVAFVGKAELQKVGERGREGDRERKDVQSPLYLLHHHIKHSLGVCTQHCST